MKKILFGIVGVLCVFGCASDKPIPHLTAREYEELYIAGNEFAEKGGSAPEAIQKLKPLDVYYDQGNVIVALQKDAHQEQGFYICPTVSSYIPKATNDGWTLRPIRTIHLSSGLYEYRRVQ